MHHLTPYFEHTGPSTYKPTEHVSGAWNIHEQHIAPALGLMLHLVEADRDRRRADGLVVSRASYDILGTVTMDEFEVSVEVRRPGRTIELIEAVLNQDGRAAVVLRVWLMARGDTASIAGTEHSPLPAPDQMPSWDGAGVWPGGFIGSVDIRRDQERPGRARFWVHTDVPLLRSEPISSTARAIGLVDIANGMTVRADPDRVLFPNIDLTAHLFRQPEGEWLGFDTTVSFGPTGQGLTTSVLHDESGPFGTSSQSLTVRPR